MAEFKKITDVPSVDEPLEGDNLLIVSDNKLKQISASSFAAASGSGGLPPVYVYGGSTAGAQGYIFDPNNVGISTFEQLFNYMTIGGPVLYTDVASGNIGSSLIPVILAKTSDGSGEFWCRVLNDKDRLIIGLIG